MEPEAVLVTGLFGSGKSSVIAEIAEILEEATVRYAAIDLDWLCWGWPGDDEDASGQRLMLMNLEPMVTNYLKLGVTRFVMAGFCSDGEEVSEMRALLAMPLHVVGLEVPWDEIERRLSSDPTRGRAVDLRDARASRDAGLGTGFEDFIVSNHERPLGDVAQEILDRIGWGEFGSQSGGR